jgi:hypothetical protein
VSTLEYRFGRWVRLYPRETREEMLGVLLASARPGQQRPGPRDVADLMFGAVCIRFRRESRALSGPVWRDAFAVLSLVVTLLLLSGTADWARGYDEASWRVLPAPAQIWPMWLPWPLVGALGLGGLRRTAAGLAWAAALSQLPWLAIAEGRYMLTTGDLWGNLFWLALALIAAAALSLSDGLRRAVTLLGWWRIILLAAGTVIFAYAVTGYPQGEELQVWPPPILSPITLLMLTPLALILAVGMRLRSADGRRHALLIVLLVSPLFTPLAQILLDAPDRPTNQVASATLVILRFAGPLLVLAITTMMAASCLHRRRRSAS